MLKNKLSYKLTSRILSFKYSTNIDVFRVNENNPTNHGTNNLGLYYTIPKEDKKLFRYGGFPKSFEIQTKTFCESSIMIRQPAIDIINSLKNMNFNNPCVRFLLFGPKGSGKSVTLIHVLHYAYLNNFLIIHIPWVAEWMRRSKEYSNSSIKNGYMDLPIDSAAWLIHFKNQNQKILENPELITSNEYEWSKRETTPKNTHIRELIDFGVNRVKFASGCISALCNEIKNLSKLGKCKTLVAIDGFNAFFYPNTRIYTDSKKVVPPEKILMTESFLNLTSYDWTNGVCVLTVDELAVAEKDHGSFYPQFLLNKNGFEHLDPFIPIKINNYSNLEFESCMKYYRDRLWVQNTENIEDQNKELSFLSAHNPYKLMQICAPL